jgi:hypothetical protein
MTLRKAVRSTANALMIGAAVIVLHISWRLVAQSTAYRPVIAALRAAQSSPIVASDILEPSLYSSVESSEVSTKSSDGLPGGGLIVAVFVDGKDDRLPTLLGSTLPMIVGEDQATIASVHLIGSGEAPAISSPGVTLRRIIDPIRFEFETGVVSVPLTVIMNSDRRVLTVAFGLPSSEIVDSARRSEQTGAKQRAGFKVILPTDIATRRPVRSYATVSSATTLR